MDNPWIIIGAVLLVYFIIMIPIQYRNIVAVKEEIRRSKKTHNEMYDEKSFEEQELQHNLQGNLLNLPSTIIASIFYKIFNPNK